MANNDIYKFRDLVAKHQTFQPKQEEQINESVDFEGSPEEARRAAEELEQYTNDIEQTLESIEYLFRRYMPREYRYLEQYTFAHFKSLIGGHGYVDRMNTSLRDLIDRLHEVADSSDEDEEI